MSNKFETRFEEGVSVHEDRTIEGYASVFNKWSNYLPGRLANGTAIQFREMILPGAFDNLIDTEDVVALYNHNEENGLLARSIKGEGSLKLSIDDYGLKYSFEAPDTSLGNDVLQSVRRGDLNSNSFVFRAAKGGDTLTKQADGTYDRQIMKVDKLMDISLVVRSAYPDALISTRALEQIEQFESDEMEHYYESLKKQI